MKLVLSKKRAYFASILALLWVTFALFSSGACGTAGSNKGNQKSESKGLPSASINVEVRPGNATDREVTERLNTLQKHYDLWRTGNLNEYRYKYMFLCDCYFATVQLPQRSIPTVTVAVSGKDFAITGFNDQRITELENRSKPDGPIETLFKLLKKEARAEEYMVRFDAKYGYPREALVDPSKQTADDGFYVEVFNFELTNQR